MSWKKKVTAIGESVSKLYITFCIAAAKLGARVTVVEAPRSGTETYTHSIGLLRTRAAHRRACLMLTHISSRSKEFVFVHFVLYLCQCTTIC